MTITSLTNNNYNFKIPEKDAKHETTISQEVVQPVQEQVLARVEPVKIEMLEIDKSQIHQNAFGKRVILY